jgi:hypothetical protein
MKQSFDSEVGYLTKLRMHYFPISLEILSRFQEHYNESSNPYNQRFVISINDQVKWQGGSVALGNGSGYITLSKDRMKKLSVVFGDTIRIVLERDFSEYGFDVPIEFQEVLNQDIIAKRRFDNLSLGFRRSIIYLVLQIKNSDKKIEKSIFFLENLKRSPEEKTTMRDILGKPNEN